MGLGMGMGVVSRGRGGGNEGRVEGLYGRSELSEVRGSRVGVGGSGVTNVLDGAGGPRDDRRGRAAGLQGCRGCRAVRPLMEAKISHLAMWGHGRRVYRSKHAVVIRIATGQVAVSTPTLTYLVPARPVLPSPSWCPPFACCTPWRRRRLHAHTNFSLTHVNTRLYAPFPTAGVLPPPAPRHGGSGTEGAGGRRRRQYGSGAPRGHDAGGSGRRWAVAGGVLHTVGHR